MTDFLKKRSKLILLLYAAVLGLVVLLALYYVTSIANVHIAYTVNSAGVISVNADSEFDSTGVVNTYFFRYFENSKNNLTDKYSVVNAGASEIVLRYGYADIVRSFQTDISSFNTLIIVYVVIGFLCFAAMLIFSNQSRRVYYKSNLYIGIVAPLIVVVFSIVMIIRNFALLGTFNDNFDLFRIVSFIMNPNTEDGMKELAINDYDIILNNTTNFNSLNFTIATIVFVVVIIYSVLLIVYTFYRYKESTKRRNDILERAANKND